MSVQEEIIDVLSKLVSFDTSINPERGIFPDDKCAKFVIKYAEENGYTNLPVRNCHFTRNGKNISEIFPVLLHKKGKADGPTILFLGHIDVVPVTESELKEWVTSPFDPVVKDGKLWGRGSGDMKAGVAAFLIAFKNFEIEKGNVIIALSGDEEIGGVDSVPQMIEVLNENNLQPDYVVNAEGSGEAVIVTKRRGGTQIEFVFDMDYQTIEGEIESKTFNSAQGGGSQSLHSMGFLLGSDIHAMVSAGKFSMDKPVVNVASTSTKTNSVPSHVTIDTVNTLVSNEKKSSIVYSKGLTGVMYALASIGSLNWPIVPSKFGPSICPNLMDIDKENKKGKITFDIRSMLKDKSSHDELAQIISYQFKLYGIETSYNIILAIDPVNVDPNHPLATKLANIANEIGFEILTVGEKLGGASDTRFFTSLDIPGVELGPLMVNGHGINEGVDLNNVKQLIHIYQKLYSELTR
ncbi:MAG: M20/M25/M40 family metallo-hydrolase [Candidatus Kariarchaeaceae archaeon]